MSETNLNFWYSSWYSTEGSSISHTQIANESKVTSLVRYALCDTGLFNHYNHCDTGCPKSDLHIEALKEFLIQCKVLQSWMSINNSLTVTSTGRISIYTLSILLRQATLQVNHQNIIALSGELHPRMKNEYSIKGVKGWRHTGPRWSPYCQTEGQQLHEPPHVHLTSGLLGGT